MKYSIIIPCYNCAHLLGDQFKALARQEAPEPWEVVIVNNNSSDDPASVVEQYRDLVPEVHYLVANEGQSCAYARNAGCEVATGDVFVFCDGDDEVATDWLATLQRAVAEHPFVTGPVEYQALNAHSGARGELRKAVRVDPYLPLMPHALGGNMAVLREAHEAVGGFDESLRSAEDIDYSWRVQRAGYALHFEPDAVIHYRLRSTPGDVYRQMRHNGFYAVGVYAKHQALFDPQKTWKEGARRWLQLVKQWRLLVNAESRPRWIRQFGYAMGLLRGSLHYRVMGL